MKSRDVIHHRGYDGNVYYTVEDEIETLRSSVVVLQNGPSVGVRGGKITESHASSAATFHLKTLSGNDPSATTPVEVTFPDGSTLDITAALSLTIPFSAGNGATLGFTSGVAARVWTALATDGGTPRLVARNCRNSNYDVAGFSATGLLSSTTIGTGADSAHTNYSDSGVTDKAYVIAAFADYDSGLTTAGTWDASPTRIVQFGSSVRKPGERLQVVSAINSGETSASTGSGSKVQTNSTVSITPSAKQNVIRVFCTGTLRTTAPNVVGAVQLSRGTGPTMFGNLSALFGSASSTIDAVYSGATMEGFDFPATTSAQAYYVYVWQQIVGNANGVTWLPNAASANSIMSAEEIMA